MIILGHRTVMVVNVVTFVWKPANVDNANLIWKKIYCFFHSCLVLNDWLCYGWYNIFFNDVKCLIIHFIIDFCSILLIGLTSFPVYSEVQWYSLLCFSVKTSLAINSFSIIHISFALFGKECVLKNLSNSVLSLSKTPKYLPARSKAARVLLGHKSETADLHNLFKCSKYRSPGIFLPEIPWVLTQRLQRSCSLWQCDRKKWYWPRRFYASIA